MKTDPPPPPPPTDAPNAPAADARSGRPRAPGATPKAVARSQDRRSQDRRSWDRWSQDRRSKDRALPGPEVRPAVLPLACLSFPWGNDNAAAQVLAILGGGGTTVTQN
eukprot:gene11363-biopygen10903